jgi:Bax protein
VTLTGIIPEIRKWFFQLSIPVRVGLVGGGVTLCFLISFIGYNIYEDHATGGVGFHYAKDLVLSDQLPVDIKKKAFFDFMRPVGVAENKRVLALRSKIIGARENGRNPGWLHDVGLDYGVEWTGVEWDRLLKRVDSVPITLILTQSANESSWAQSRFARIGNNMFGEWCFVQGCGLVPGERDTDKSHEVSVYGSVNESVRSYLNNINSSRAYSELRAIRWRARQQGREASGTELAVGLQSYSERGQAYVSDIQSMIRANRTLMIGE